MSRFSVHSRAGWGFLGALALAGAASAVGDEMVPMFQDRTLNTGALITVESVAQDSDSDTSGAIGFAPYSALIQSNALFGVQTASGTASQNSSFSATTISAIGSAAAATDAGLASTHGEGSSYFFYTFEVTTPVSFELVGNLFGSHASADASFELYADDPNSPLLTQHVNASSLPLSLTGVLNPGTYNILALASATADEGSGATASFDFTLTVPEPTTLVLVAAGMLLTSRRR